MGSRLDAIKDWEGIGRKVSYCAAALAVHLEMSDRHLRRYFILHFGETPQHYLDQLRLTESIRALAKGVPIKEVAYQFGFKQPSHFSRKFKQTFGYAPSSCRGESVTGTFVESCARIVRQGYESSEGDTRLESTSLSCQGQRIRESEQMSAMDTRSPE